MGVLRSPADGPPQYQVQARPEGLLRAHTAGEVPGPEVQEEDQDQDEDEGRLESERARASTGSLCMPLVPGGESGCPHEEELHISASSSSQWPERRNRAPAG